jgi:hypothetical protein
MTRFHAPWYIADASGMRKPVKRVRKKRKRVKS